MSGREATERVRAAYDKLARSYDDTYTDAVTLAEDRRVLRTLRPAVLRARSVLDVGCGTGWVLDQFSHNFAPPGLEGRHYTGFDISPRMLDRLVQKHPWVAPCVREMDVNAWEPEIAQYDLVVSTFASPSYVVDRETFAKKLALTTTDDGAVYLMPHGHGAERRVPYLKEPDAYVGDVPWSEREAVDVLTQAGFRRVEVTGMRHPQAGPSEHRGRLWQDGWLALEQRLFRPDALSFLVVRAWKR